MKSDKKTKLIFFIFILFLFSYLANVLYYSLNRTLDEVAAFKKEKPQQSSNPIESYIKQAKIRVYDQAYPKYEITSAYIQNNKQLNFLLLEQPEVLIFKINNFNQEIPVKHSLTSLPSKRSSIKTRIQWFITADTGRIRLDNDKINLNQNVNIKQLEHQIQLTTDNLDIWPDKSIAKNKTLVSIKTNSSMTTSHGLILDLNKQNYQLLNKVKMIIQPN